MVGGGVVEGEKADVDDPEILETMRDPVR